MGKDNQKQPGNWSKEEAEEVMKRLGPAGVLNEPPSEMSRFYVTETFTGYGDPLAPFRDAFAPMANTDLKRVLEEASARGTSTRKNRKGHVSSRSTRVDLREAQRLLLLHKLEVLDLSLRQGQQARERSAGTLTGWSP